MNIDSIMVRDLVTVSMDHTLDDVRSIFLSHRFHHLLVVEDGKLVGIVSDRDLLRNISPFIGTKAERTQDVYCLDRKVHQFMTRNVITVSPDTPIKVAMSMLLWHNISCVPVTDGQKHPVGICTWHDMMRYSLECGVEPGCTIDHTKPPPKPGDVGFKAA